jgi:hypothetical protein
MHGPYNIKNSLVYKTIKLWNQVPAEILATLHCTSCIVRKRVRKWGEVTRFLSAAVTKYPKLQGREKLGVKCSEVMWRKVKWCEGKWSEVIIFGEIHVLSLIYTYVAACMFCVVCCLIIICFCLLFSNYSTYVFKYYFHVCSLFCVFCAFYCFAYCFTFYI